MGTMEKASRTRTRKNQLSEIILESVKLAGLVSLLVVAPSVVGALSKLGIIPSRQHGPVIKRATDRLIQKGLLEWKGSKLRITERGEYELHRSHARTQAMNIPKRWDKKWRVVVFDIPERRKGLRARLKAALQHVGYVRLQNSVWVFPYDNEDFVALLKADFKLGDDVRYMIVETIERDEALRTQFSLA